MRTLVWITVGFAACCCVAAYRLWIPVSVIPAFAGFFLALLVLLFGRKCKAGRSAALILLGFAAGWIWYQFYDAHYLHNAAILDGVTTQAEIYTTDYSYETGYGLGVDGTMEVEGRSYSVRVYLEEGKALAPGALLQGSFRFRMTTPDSQEGPTSHSGKGIFLLAYQDAEVTVLPDRRSDFLTRAAILRRQIAQILKGSFPEDVFPFCKALLLGDISDLSYEVDTYLKLSGIRHVAAVSGLHVSILFALAMNLALRKRFLSAGIGIPVLLIFAAVTGFTPSVNRACIMSGLMLLALVVNREYDGLSALAFSAFVMLILNPLVITSVSFQLSCASVAGIFLFSEAISGGLRPYMGNMKGKKPAARLKRWFLSSVSTSLSAMVFTVPLCAWYFGTVSLIGVVTNLLTLWIIGGIFYGLIAVCILNLLHPAAAAVFGELVAVPVRFVLLTAKCLSAFPFACVYTASGYIVFWLVFVYVLLILYSITGKGSISLLLPASVAGLCLALLLSWVEPLLYDTSVTVLDVGQGQCILLQSEGKNYLVDCGGDQDTRAADSAAEWLLSLGISRLDGVIVTHTDRDHAGGVTHLLKRIDTALLILPPVYWELAPEDTNVIYADRKLVLNWGDTKLCIFGEEFRKSDNENSLCILLDTEKCDILITGDRNEAGEVRLLQTAEIPTVDILIAGHHGSKYATSEQLLQAVKPEIVCISASEENIYGHPAPETLSRLYSHGCRVYRTDLHGTVTIRR